MNFAFAQNLEETCKTLHQRLSNQSTEIVFNEWKRLFDLYDQHYENCSINDMDTWEMCPECELLNAQRVVAEIIYENRQQLDEEDKDLLVTGGNE